MSAAHYGGQGWTLHSSSWGGGWSSGSQRPEVTVAWESFSTHPQRAVRLPGNKKLLGYISEHRNKHPPCISESFIPSLHFHMLLLTSAAGGAALCVSAVEPHVGRLRLWRHAGRCSDLLALRFLFGDAAMDLLSPEWRDGGWNWKRIVKSSSA